MRIILEKSRKKGPCGTPFYFANTGEYSLFTAIAFLYDPIFEVVPMTGRCNCLDMLIFCCLLTDSPFFGSIIIAIFT